MCSQAHGLKVTAGKRAAAKRIVPLDSLHKHGQRPAFADFEPFCWNFSIGTFSGQMCLAAGSFGPTGGAKPRRAADETPPGQKELIVLGVWG